VSDSALLSLAVLIHLGIAITLSALFSADVDEMYTLSTTSLSPMETIRRALSFEQQPPLYFLLVSLWREIHPGLFWARLFSVACTASTIVVAAFLRRRFVPEAVSPGRPATPDGLFALVMAVNPFLIWASFNARGYAFLILLSALLLHFGTRAFSEGPVRWGRVAVFTAVAAMGLYVQYYFGFLVAAFGAVLIVRGRWRSLLPYMAAMAALALVLLPLLWHTMDHVGTHAVSGGGAEGHGGFEEMGRRVESLVLSMHRVSMGREMRWLARMLFWGTAAASVIIAFRMGANHRYWLAPAVLVAGIAFPMALVWILVGSEVVQFRHSAVLLVPSLFLAFALLDVSGKPFLTAGGSLIILVMSANAIWHHYHDLDRNPSHKSAAAWIDAHTRMRPDQPIFVFPSDSALSLRHHFPGPNVVAGIPMDASLVSYIPQSFALSGPEPVRARLASLPWPDGCAWLVQYADREVLGLDLGAAYLDAVVARDFRTIDAGEFEDCTVRLLCKGDPE
jgi:hypothetical protein